MSAMTWLPKDVEAAEQLIDEAETDDFAKLIKIAGLDPKQHLRFADWSGVNFWACDLQGFDFTGARLNGCRFGGARIEGARFDQAEIDGANLPAAVGWETNQRNWVKVPQPVRGDHLPAGAVFQDAPFAPKMVAVPPGRFWMDSKEGEGDPDEHPWHEVTIPHTIAVGRYPVTFEEWDFAQADKDWAKITGLKPREPGDAGWERGRRPVIDVSWKDAQAYATWLSHKTGQPYRLLSEAEWEYACRAGSEAVYCFGDSETELGDYAWHSANSKSRTHPVGEKKPNRFGLYDMHGNVLEWCEDVWHNSYEVKQEVMKETGGAWTTGDGSRRVLRGGSWFNNPHFCYSAFRSRGLAVNRDYYCGFRLARTLNY